MPNPIERLDAGLATLLADWSLLTTLLALALLAFIAYPILYPDEPDTHPLLLARQSAPAPIRNLNESPVYRSPETPYGYPLKTGLNVKDAGAPRWANGRNGDLRDVWREVMRGGSVGEDGKVIPRGLVMTVLGREEVVEEDLEELTRQIGVMGQAWREAGVEKVAVYLPNSMEYLLTIFGACEWCTRKEMRVINANMIFRQLVPFTASPPYSSRTTNPTQRYSSSSTPLVPTPLSAPPAIFPSTA